MYSIYLRGPDQAITERTDTPDRDVALAAFEALIAHREFDGSEMRAILNHQHNSLGHHRFNCLAGSEDYWRGRVHQLGALMPLTHDRGANGGRLISVYLDAKAMARAERLGHGDPALGVRRALLHACDSEPARSRSQTAPEAVACMR